MITVLHGSDAFSKSVRFCRKRIGGHCFGRGEGGGGPKLACANAIFCTWPIVMSVALSRANDE